MKHLDVTFLESEKNLACDEVLLDLVEEGDHEEILRFWEPQQYFVVLGSSNRIHEEVFVEKCEADGIPILRRHSGGGTVLQGPGCLNYSVILRINSAGPTRNITDTTRHIMQRHAGILSQLLNKKVEMKGSSDLAIDGKKFSGNAQRRRLKTLLFHGTFLLNFSIDLIEKHLKMPPKQPAYRGGRKHSDFLTNIGVESEYLKRTLMNAWNVNGRLATIPHDRIADLVDNKYSRSEWTFKL